MLVIFLYFFPSALEKRKGSRDFYHLNQIVELETTIDVSQNESYQTLLLTGFPKQNIQIDIF